MDEEHRHPTGQRRSSSRMGAVAELQDAAVVDTVAA
jgi:hypothetical protein